MTGLDALVLTERLRAPNGPYAAVDLVASTGSTNADLLARAGAADYTALVAAEQTAGRGRRSRQWASPAGSGVYLSVLVRPSTVPADRLGSLSLVAGVALVRAARAVGVDTALKWPNDLLVDGAKCAGVLAEVAPDGAAVVGIGLNVTAAPDAPAGPGDLLAGALGAAVDPTEVTAALLTAFAELETSWRGMNGDLAASGVLAAYRDNCATLGRRVRAELPDGSAPTGVATELDVAGQLVLSLDDGTDATVSAGDVVHLRDEEIQG